MGSVLLSTPIIAPTNLDRHQILRNFCHESVRKGLIMRAIPIVGDQSIETARAYHGVADCLLLDSHDLGDRQIGALGRTHDWRISRRIVDEVGIPAILAGGLDADNVVDAIAAVRPAGVDSKTKTDLTDGSGKDLEKVRRFVDAAKLTR